MSRGSDNQTMCFHDYYGVVHTSRAQHPRHPITREKVEKKKARVGEG